MRNANGKMSFLRCHASRFLAVSLLVASIGVVYPGVADSLSATAHPQVTKLTQVDGDIYEIAFNPQGDRLYAAVVGRHVVSADGDARDTRPGVVVLDGQTLHVVDRIDTGDISPFGLALNAETQKLYVTDTRHGAVAVYDVDSGKRVALISAPEGKADHVRQPVVDATTNTVYVSVVGGWSRDGGPAPESAIWVIDGSTDTLEDVIENPVQVATGLALDPTSKRLYVSDLANSLVAEIDMSTHEVLRKFSAAAGSNEKRADTAAKEGGVGTVNLELDPARGLLYAVNQKRGGIAVIDLDQGNVIDSIRTGEGALSAKLNPRTGDLYVANRNDGTIAVVDGETRHVSAYLPGGSHPQTVAIAPESGVVYVSNKAKGRGRGAANDVPTPFEPGGNTVIRIEP